MKNVLKIIGLILLIGGAIVANFSTIALVDYVSIAVSALGLALTILSVWNKTEKKTWKELVSIICFAIGGFCCGIAGVSESTITTLITGIAGVVVIIIGIVTASVKIKNTTKES